ncbi:hypothetical protein EPI10_023931 [Gossypium australe]|uniref:Reverse transcriptase n=1 Tax=Gossypium australe TaxID=47621 RepID=A0A5B6VX37_9ROSI|nr:hypothetical protein EPI10_023931 [Gossypium australe]
MWTNNREGNGLIKERLDRFLFSTFGVENTPFLSTYVVRQPCSDHDEVVLDTLGHTPRDEVKDPRLPFKFEACWAHKKKAKYFIKRAWGTDNDVINGMERVCSMIGPWQYRRFKRMKSRICRLAN